MSEKSQPRITSPKFTNSGHGPQNVHEGPGNQLNPSITGGSYNQILVGGPNTDPDEPFRDALYLTCPPIDRDHLISVKGAIVPDTCTWILNTDEYKQWLQGDVQPILLIWGGPGKGKTMLSIFISEQLERTADTIFFFCKAEQERRNSDVAVLRGLLRHLTELRPNLTQVLRKKFRSLAVFKDALAERETLWRLFTEFTGAVNSDQLYCILDRLDECDDNSRLWLAKEIAKLNSDGGNRFKMVLVSRDLSNSDLATLNQVPLDFDYAEEVRSSVASFIDHKMEKLARSFRFDDALLSYVHEQLLDRRLVKPGWLANSRMSHNKYISRGCVSDPPGRIATVDSARFAYAASCYA